MWSLIALNLARNPVRVGLSAISLTVALLLFMLLQSIAARFDLDAEDADRLLLVLPKHRSGYQLPLTHLDRIRAVEGVAAVTPIQPFYGYFRELTNDVGGSAVLAEEIVRMIREPDIDPEVLRRFRNTRTGALVSASLAQAHGWQAGDTVPVHSRVYTRSDRSRVVGVVPTRNDADMMFLHLDYLSESYPEGIQRTSMLQALVAEAADPTAVAQQIDEALSITPEPTTTITSDYASRNWARQLGDIGRIISFILGAVFFSVLIVTANGAVQAMRERVAEHAIMKTVGFSNVRACVLLLGENVLLCLPCGAMAIGAAHLLEPVFNENLSSYVGGFEMSGYHSVLTGAVALGTAALISLWPALELWRLDVVAALTRD
jgi:putative ABC transport system permease protein